MVLLIALAFLAGAATAVSPCALPVLPVVFAAGVTGGRRRPLGIAAGLAASFTLAVVLLVYVISALGLPDGLIRTFAIAVLLVFGLSLLLPRAGDWVEFQLSRLTSRGAGKVAGTTQELAEGKEGFWSGFLIGSGLGFVYAPCAGPILAGVITATAAQPYSTQRLVVALAYGLGSAATFLALMVGGRRLIGPLISRSQRIQYAMGLAMVFVAVAMFANLDTRFQTAIASGLPSSLVNPTGKLEQSEAVRDDLDRARGSSNELAQREREIESQPGVRSSLPVLGTAPEIVGTQEWFNTPGGERLTLAQLRGKVVLVDFWTYTCINCIRTQPYLRAWDRKYRDDGLVIVGVHTPEFAFERSAGNVQAAVKQAGIEYPVAQDNAYRTWDNYANQYWPAHYLVDSKGRVRATHFGEGEYEKTEQQIRSLLAETGKRKLGDATRTSGVVRPSDEPVTRETYLGAARADGWSNGPITPGTHTYPAGAAGGGEDAFRFIGRWKIADQYARAAGAGSRIHADIRARRVYLVLSSPGRPRRVAVEVDGRPISAQASGSDVRGGYVRVSKQRLYSLAVFPRAENHRVTLRFARGVSGYAFTFG